ncbi:MAG: phage terminase large subunit [Oligoflexia bacterium]|nr:phage terminase large subunit [Oligoflexia bacterium]
MDESFSDCFCRVSIYPHICTFLSNWHIDLISEYLEAISIGEFKRLIVNIPPRYLKSMICTVTFPAWIWTKKPHRRFITSCYSSDLSIELSYKRRQLIESPWYKLFWSKEVKLERDQNQKSFYQNTKTGFMYSTSTGGSVTGKGCDIMIIDDPHNPMQAESDVQRETGVRFWRETLSSRFNDPKEARILVVMQRLHENDLTGYLLENEEDWIHLKIPNECEQRTVYSFPISGKTKIYEVEEILHPEFEGRKELSRSRVSLGSYGYAAQKQQDPAPREGGIIKKHWFKYYDLKPEYFEKITISWDMAFKNLDENDYVVGQVWGKVKAQFYLIDQVRGKMSFTESCNAVEVLAERYKGYNEILIEEKANGAAVIDTLKSKITSLIAINPKESKISRLNAISPMIEAGNIFIPNPSFYPWVNDFIFEVCSFPKASNDDQVDAMTQYLNRENAPVPLYTEEDILRARMRKEAAIERSNRIFS